MDNTAKRQAIVEAMQQMNCKDCGNWLCGAFGSDQEVLCFLGYPKKEAQEDV